MLDFNVHVSTPPGYEVENVPSGRKIESEFGLYEMQVEKLVDRVVVTRFAEIRPLQVPAARYAEVRQFFLDSAKADAAQMVLIKKRSLMFPYRETVPALLK